MDDTLLYMAWFMATYAFLRVFSMDLERVIEERRARHKTKVL